MTKGQYPTISSGLGNLTPELWRRLMIMLAEYEKKNSDQTSQRKKRGGGTNYFLAKITGSSAISDNRYEYEWTEVVLDDETGFEDLTDGRTGDDALNLCEMSNTVDNVSPAVDMNGSTYPPDFTMRAIGSCIDTVQLDTVVVMFILQDSEGTLRSVFSLANAHDGEC